MTRTNTQVPTERIAGMIRVVRGHKVLLDADLAALYGAATRVLVQAIKRNLARFPADFLFQLTDQEVAGLRSQFVISNAGRGRGGRRYRPYAFSEILRAIRELAASPERARKRRIGFIQSD